MFAFLVSYADWLFSTRSSIDQLIDCAGPSARHHLGLNCGSESRCLTCYRYILSHEGEDASACTPASVRLTLTEARTSGSEDYGTEQHID